MKEFVFRRLQGIIESLENSTFLRIEYAGMSCVLQGRNSPYVSHREVEYGKATLKQEGWLLLENKNYLLGIYYPKQDMGEVPFPEEKVIPLGGKGVYHERVITSIPSAMIHPLHSHIRGELQKYLGLEFPSDGLISVLTYHPIVVGFEGKKPIYKTDG